MPIDPDALAAKYGVVGIPVSEGGDWESLNAPSSLVAEQQATSDANAAKPKKESLFQSIVRRANERAELAKNKPLLTRIKEAVGNAPFEPMGMIGRGVEELYNVLPEDWQRPDVPIPTIAGITKGALGAVAAPIQLAAHIPVSPIGMIARATGVGPEGVDKAISQGQDYFDQNFDQSLSGEMIGSSLPMLFGGAAGAAPKAATTLGRLGMGALRTAGTAALPAVFTPETDVTGEGDYWGRKGTETALGLGTAAAIPALGAVTRGAGKGINWIKSKVAASPAVEEMQNALASSFGGAKPGEALQNAANAEYDKAWAPFKQMAAELKGPASTATVNYQNTLATLDDKIAQAERVAGGTEESGKLLNYLKQLRSDLQEASGQYGPIPESPEESVSFLRNILSRNDKTPISDKMDAAMQTIKSVGDKQRELEINHKGTLSRGTLSDVRNALLQDVDQSVGNLGLQYGDLRKYFREQIVPMFDSRQGGNWLTKVREGWDPNDILQSLGSLKKVDKITKIASGSSSDPLVWQAVENAKNKANGNPLKFASTLQESIPAIEAIADPSTLDKIKNMISTAKISGYGGNAANAAATMALGAVPGGGPVVAGAFGFGSQAAPGMFFQGRTWQAFQNPKVRQMLSKSWNIPVNSPEFDAKLTQFLALQEGRTQQP